MYIRCDPQGKHKLKISKEKGVISLAIYAFKFVVWTKQSVRTFPMLTPQAEIPPRPPPIDGHAV